MVSDDAAWAANGFAGKTIKNIETLSVTNADATGALTMVATGTGIKNITSSASQHGVVVTGVEALGTLALENASTTNSDLTVTYANAAVAGTADAVTLALNTAGTAAAPVSVTINSDGAEGVETVNISSTGGASVIQALTVQDGAAADEMSKIVVTGNKNLNLAATTALTFAEVSGTDTGEIDASAFTGNLTVNLTTAGTHTVTGGTGDDRFNFGGTLTKADKVTGGDGTDTLAVTQAGVTAIQALSDTDKAALNANLAGLEKVAVTDALTGDIDASRFDAINSFVLEAGLNNGGTSTLSKVASGATVEIQDAAGTATDILAVQITDATVAGNNSDVLNIVLNDAAAGGASDIGVLNAVGTDTLNISTKSLTAAGAAGTTTSYVLDIANTSTALDKVVVTGDIDLDMDTVALVNSIGEVDASAFTGALQVAIAAGGTNGVKITGGSKADTITSSDAADIINGGGGFDAITIRASNTGAVIKSDVTEAKNADIITTFQSTDTTFSYIGTLSNEANTTIAAGTVASGATLQAAVTASNSAVLFNVTLAAQDAALETATDNFIAGPTTALADTLEAAAVTALGAVANIDTIFTANESVLIVLDNDAAGTAGNDSLVFRFTNTNATGNAIDAGELTLVGVFVDEVVVAADFY